MSSPEPHPAQSKNITFASLHLVISEKFLSWVLDSAVSQNKLYQNIEGIHKLNSRSLCPGSLGSLTW